MVECPICNREFKCISNTHIKTHNLTKEQFLTQFPNTEMNSKEFLDSRKRACIIRSKNSYESCRISSKIRFQNRISEYNKNPKLCVNCNVPTDYKYRNNKYCQNCIPIARKFSRNCLDSNKEKVVHCKICNKELIVKINCSNNPLCDFCNHIGDHSNIYLFKCKKCEDVSTSRVYQTKICNKCKIQMKEEYRKLCQFDFSINEFPKEFESDLIIKYGWYKAKNRGNNLNGVSRDHKFSISDAFELKVGPDIIKHPANCELMRHRDNSKKHTKSSITFEELLDRIEIWNDKYGG